ncbi:hypothetical protein GF339_09845 [candidate division KSB3 bacterium]|uniref:Divergent polysaccharide deacetylase family protein n=1 Tax=candidate division KSB3 bacterium TaxID=2044937 RepID=A0A9D5JVT6_9BACT|nr:hypothetical protein [candidate division KSB3 bacterium]MBD3324876.1 hypothetical protein [candidate division KSB3 bacterium]
MFSSDSSEVRLIVKTKKRILVISLTVLVALIGLLVTCGAFLWEEPHSRFFSRRRSGQFPAATAKQLGDVIQQALHTSDSVKLPLAAPTQQTIHHEPLSWTQYAYTVHLQQRSALSTLLYELSELIVESGGEIFQSYFQPEQRQVTFVLGVGEFITHTIVFTWDAPPPVVERPAPRPQVEAEPAVKAAIIIDDLGTSTHVVQRLLDLEADLTFSILPHLQYSRTIAALLHERGKEMLLHLPMEPQDYPATSPGAGAILVNMAATDIQQTIDQNLHAVPFVVGANNHMGSRLTADSQAMQAVLETLGRHDLFFLDSRTTGQSVAYSLAQQLGIQSAERKIFLDVIPELAFVKQQLRELAALAEQGEPAIAIGHPKAVTLQALEEMLPEFKDRQIEIVRVSTFVQ